MVAKKEIKPRVAKRVLMYRARKELPVRTDRGRIQKGEQVTLDKAEAIAAALGTELEELFEEIKQRTGNTDNGAQWGWK